ncbi:MAG: helix-turn-helix domain-containing protein [Spirochaetes bacterium]|nr:helix-turn-helix domain-containing protein [Spirochaetota bacterium]
MDQTMYSIEELTSILRLHRKTILRFIHEGKIRARKIGRSWMVTRDDLREYTHAELASDDRAAVPRQSGPLVDRIAVSAVVEINEQNSEEAARISNSLMAMLNCKDESWGRTRFDFFYHPEIQKARYVLYGSPKFIGTIMETFEALCRQRGEA